MRDRVRAAWIVGGLAVAGTLVFANPFPPFWEENGGPGPARHHDPVAWPNEPSPAQCGAACGDWIPYSRFGNSINDPRVQDPSNGGTAPQNYVNVASSCLDKNAPSIYYYLHKDPVDSENDVVMFRWRVEQPAHNYATGPSAGNFSSSNPWSSALWTVLFDIDGSGYRTLAAHLNGSSGAPAAAIDTLAGIWSNTPSQSIDYLNDANVHLLGHNPTAFIGPSNKVLNFQNSVTPTESWVNGANETVWDYGTTRASLVTTSPCSEYFIDYQIPVAMLDASGVGGPKITRDTPISMLFCTANSLSNPFQKDCAINRRWAAGASTPAPFGDYISFNKAEPYQQAIVSSVTAEAPSSCPGNYKLTAKVQDALALQSGVVVPSVQDVDFYYWYDRNGDGLATAADTGSAWTKITPAATLKSQTLNTWTASWDATALPKGKYLIGVQALDDAALLDDGMTSTGVNNRTFSYISGDGENRVYQSSSWIAGQQALFPAHSPVQTPSSSEDWFGNPTVTGNQVAVIGTAINTCGLAPTIALNRSPASVAGGGVVNFTVTIANPSGNAGAITVSSIEDTLPSGFTYVNSSTSGMTTADPAVNGQDLTWTFGTPINVGPGANTSLTFGTTAASASGTYNNVATATTSFGELVSSPVAVTVDSARLALSLSPSAYSVAANGSTPLTYTLRYANDSGVGVTGATLTSSVPPGATYVSCTGGTSCGYVAGNATFNLGTLAGGASGTVSFTVTVPNSWATSSITTTATLSATAPDSGIVSANASSTVAVTGLAGSPSFTLTNVASAPRIDPANNVTYTLTYKNVGDGGATNVVLTDTLPAGMAFVSCSDSCSSGSGTVTWNIGAVAAGASGTRTLTVAADSPFLSANPATNTASINWTGGAPVEATVDIGVTGQACSTYYFKGDSVLINGSTVSGSVTNRQATETAPISGTASTINFSASNAGFVEFARFYQSPASTNTVTFNGDLTTTFYVTKSNGPQLLVHGYVYDYNPANNTETLLGNTTSPFSNNGNSTNTAYSFTIPLVGQLAKDHRLLWKFTASSNNNINFNYLFDGTASPTRARYCVTPPANLTLANIVSSATVAEGATPTLKYTLSYANTGGTSATNASLTNTLPTGFTNCEYSTDNSSWHTCSGASAHTFTLGTVVGGGSGTVYVRGTVPVGTTGGDSLTDTATLTSDQTSNVTTTSLTEVIGSSGTAALALSMSTDRSAAIPGQSVTYTVTVVNVGTGTATNVVVASVLPSSSYYTYAGCTDSCVPGGGFVTWPAIATLPAGASDTLAFTMNVGSTGLPAGITTINADASATGDAALTASSNNTAVALNGNASLAVLLTPSAGGGLGPDDLITYTLTVQNTGAADAQNVSASVGVPNNTAYSGNVTPSQGSGAFDAIGNRVVFDAGTIASSSTATLTFQVRVNSPLTSGTTVLANSASAVASNASEQTTSAAINASAAPNLFVGNDLPSSVPFPSAVLTSAASGTTLFVNRTDQFALDQLVSVDGDVARITAISARSVTVDAPISAVSGTPVFGAVKIAVPYSNTGDADATAAVIDFELPVALGYVESSPSATSSPIVGNSGTVTWAVGTLAAGASGTVEIIAFPLGFTGSFASVATLSASNAVDASRGATIAIGGLVVTKTTSTPTRAPGGDATYSIVVTNSLASSATATVEDVLPTGFSYKAASATVGGVSLEPTFDADDTTSLRPTWSNVIVPANSSLVIQFEAHVDSDIGAAAYQNEVNVLAAGGVGVMTFDPLTSTAEDVTILDPASGLLKGYVFARSGNSNAGFNASGDTPLAGVRIEIHKLVSDCSIGTDCYVVYSDADGYFERVVAAANWIVTVVPNTGGLDSTWPQIAGTNHNAVSVPSQGEVTDQNGFSSSSLPSHVVSTSVGANGSVTPTTQNIDDGDTATLTVTPDSGYSISSVSGCGGSLAGNTYTTGTITADCTVTAAFISNSIPTHLVSTSSGANGSISPTSRTVTAGLTTTFTVTADPGYLISTVTGCGGSLNGSTYTTAAINAVCTVSATFIDANVTSYTLAANAAPSAGGSVQGAGVFQSGANATLTALPATGYTFTNWTEGSTVLGTASIQSVTMNADRTLIANFALNSYTVGTTSTTGGSLSPSIRTVSHGNTTTFVATPSEGYSLASITGCSGTRDGTTYTTAAVIAACNVTATFVTLGPTIQPAPPANIRARALFTEVPLTLAPIATDATGTPLTVTLVGAPLKLRPGRHTLTWGAQDSLGRVVTTTQLLNIWPTISLGADLVLGYGNSSRIVATLNGESPLYPYSVGFTVGGDGGLGTRHTLAAGEFTFVSGTESTVSFDTLPQTTAPAPHKLAVTLDPTENIGQRGTMNITLLATNAAPNVAIVIEQADRTGTLVARSGGPITLHADVLDPNVGDAHTLAWTYPSGLNVQISSDGRELTFDPLSLNVGVHEFSVLATDNGNAPLSTRARTTLALRDAAPALGTGDSNGNGISDHDEGWTDSGNGIPTYLNRIAERNVLPEDVEVTTEYLIESDASAQLRVGSRAQYSGTGGARLTPNALPALITADQIANVGGYFDLEGTGLALAQTVSIVIPQRVAIPAQPVYRLWDPATQRWTTFVENASNSLKSAPGEPGFCPAPGSDAYQLGLIAGSWCVQVTLSDGGPNDLDHQTNGALMKVGGVGMRAVTEVTGESKGGGGAMDAWMLVLLIVALLRGKHGARMFAVASCCFVSVASAADRDAESEREGWYLGGQALYVRGSVDAKEMDARLAASGYTTQTELEGQTRLGGKLFGGYRWSHLALELGYADLGHMETRVRGSTSISDEYLQAVSRSHPQSGSGAQLSALGYWPLSERFEVFGRAGLFSWRSNMSADGRSDYEAVDDRSTDPFLGLGLTYRAARRWSTSLEWNGYELASERIHALGLMITYRFDSQE